MEPSDRRKLSIAALLLGLGIASIMLTYCRVGAGSVGRAITVGYSNGQELFNGNCKNRTTLWECIDCCLTLGVGLPEKEQLDCVDRCIALHSSSGGSDLTVIDAFLDIADIVRSNKTADFVAYNNAKRMLRLCQNSSHERIARMAKILCRELRLAEPLQS